MFRPTLGLLRVVLLSLVVSRSAAAAIEGPELTPPPPESDIDERETAMLAKVADEPPAPPPPEATLEQHPSTLSTGGQLFLFARADLRLPGLGAFMDWSPAGKGRYQPSLRAGFLRTLDAQTDDGLAVMLTAGTVGACPLGFRTTPWLVLSACADFVAGIVDVGEGVHGRWLGLTGMAHVPWTFVVRIHVGVVAVVVPG